MSLKITQVLPGSPASRNGIQAGDVVESVNGNGIRDVIDYIYYSADESPSKVVLRRGDKGFSVDLVGDGECGMSFEDIRIRRCKNKCIFCFVDQLPSGMRRSLYVKDEDYRLSFLHGAYVTLTDISDKDIKRIIDQRLSPLYISVHTTDPDLRGRMLGLKAKSDILSVIDVLAVGKIEMHCQIVICPGINDGEILEKTIFDLASYFPYIRSVALVPVGLTRHRGGLPGLIPVGRREAEDCLKLAKRLSSRFKEDIGENFIYAADEFYLLCGQVIPPASEYGEFYQIENGVGMVRDFLDTFDRKVKKLRNLPPRGLEVTLVTGKCSYPFICDIAEKAAEIGGFDIEVVEVENRFFGSEVTVSGLLTGRDMADTLSRKSRLRGIVLLPPNCVNSCGLLLDDMSPDGIAISISREVIVSSYDIVDTLVSLSRKQR